MRAPSLAPLIAGAAIACSLIALGAHSVAQAEHERAPVVSFNDGSQQCGAVTLSPYADRDTIAAALREAAAIVQHSGCVNVAFDDAGPVHSHLANYGER